MVAFSDECLHDRAMDTTDIAFTLDGLSSEKRLSIFRLLVRTASNEGLAVGEIARRLGMSASTLAFHLRCLVQCGLVRQVKQGREVICHANLERLQSIVAVLESECCVDVQPGRMQETNLEGA